MFEREDNTHRFTIEAVGYDDDALRLGVAWLLQWAREQAQPAAFAMYAYDNWRRLQPILGAPLIKALEKCSPVTASGVDLHLITERRRPGFFDGPILSVWLNDKRLRKIDELGASAICAIPWSEGNIDEWKAAWGPRDLRSLTTAAKADVSPVVAAALRSLTVVVNVSTGVTHPDDRASAIDLFRCLRNGGEAFSPAGVRAWAARNGWAPSDADELAIVAEKILEGKALRGGGARWRSDALAKWRKEAGE